MNGKDEFEDESRRSDPMSITSGWQFAGAVSNEDLSVSSCPSTSMSNLFTPTLMNSGFCSSFNEQNSIVTGEGLNSLRSNGVDWSQQNPWMKGVFSGNVHGFPANLSQLPADSAFIERAARFSCFNSRVFGASPPVGPFDISNSIGIHSRQEVMSRNGASTDGSLPMELEAKEKSPSKNEKESEMSQARGKESDEAGFSGGHGERCVLEGTITEPSMDELCLKKRKRDEQNLDKLKKLPNKLTELPRMAHRISRREHKTRVLLRIILLKSKENRILSHRILLKKNIFMFELEEDRQQTAIVLLKG